MSKDEPTNDLPNSAEYIELHADGTTSTTRVYPGLTDDQRSDFVAYLKAIIDLVEEKRVFNAEIKVTNETVQVPEWSCVADHVPTGIKVVDLMIRFA